MSNELCEAEVRKNLVLVEIGEPLTLPLSVLNQSCDFRKKWDEIQNKWHGPTVEELGKRKIKKEFSRDYNSRPEVKEKGKIRQKTYNDRPEAKAKKKAYNLVYNLLPKSIAKRKEYIEKAKNDPQTKIKRQAYYMKNQERLKKIANDRYHRNKRCEKGNQQNKTELNGAKDNRITPSQSDEQAQTGSAGAEYVQIAKGDKK